MTLTSLLEGSRVKLVPLNSSDTASVARWQHDTSYLRLLDANAAYPKSESQVGEWIREGQRGREHFLFGIASIKGYKLILKYKEERIKVKQ